MKVVRGPSAVQRASRALRKKGRLGFVPTMGALHEGHLSLVRRAAKENDAVVASIFVNPLQFGPKEDYRRYPRTLRADTRLLRRAGADILFAPSAAAFYEPGFETEVRVKRLSQGLCGRSRPLHFAGVATVVTKLLNLVGADTLYLGQKDYQQARVVAQMVKDLALPVDVRVCPTVRERDGLAMSSRNAFLTPAERRQARNLFLALGEARRRVRRGERSAAVLRGALRRALGRAQGARIEYAEIVDAQSLEPVVKLTSGRKILVALAVRFSRTRLIDNCLLRVK